MFTPRIVKIALLLSAVFLFSSSAYAQYPEAGEVFLSFNSHQQISTRTVAPGIPFDLYVLVRVSDPDSLSDHLAGIEGSIELGPKLTWVGQEWAGVGLNLGSVVVPDGVNLYNFIVGTGDCIALGPDPVWVGTVTLVLNELVIDHPLSLGAPHVDASTPSSFNDIGPGYANCDLDLILFSTTAENTGVTLNPSAVPVSDRSWGMFKSGF